MPHVAIPQAEFKVVILGDTHIGKTSLVTRFAEGYYREHSRPATVGAFFITKRIQTSDNTSCKIQIWDTAGQENFRAMAHMFYRNAAAAIVCYDVGSKRSFDVMREWIDELRRKTPAGEVVIAIAALKSDLLQGNNKSPAIPEYEVEELAGTLGAIYLPTSAKTDQNVNALFQRVADHVLEKRKSAKLTRNNITIDDGDYNMASGDNRINISSPRNRYDKYYVPNQNNTNDNLGQDNGQTMDMLNGGNRLPDTPHNYKGTKNGGGRVNSRIEAPNNDLQDGENVLLSNESQQKRRTPSFGESMCTDQAFACGVVDSNSSCLIQ